MIGLAGPYVLATVLTAAALATVFIFLRPDPRDISRRTLHAQAHAPAEETVRRQGEVFRLPPKCLPGIDWLQSGDLFVHPRTGILSVVKGRRR